MSSLTANTATDTAAPAGRRHEASAHQTGISSALRQLRLLRQGHFNCSRPLVGTSNDHRHVMGLLKNLPTRPSLPFSQQHQSVEGRQAALGKLPNLLSSAPPHHCARSRSLPIRLAPEGEPAALERYVDESFDARRGTAAHRAPVPVTSKVTTPRDQSSTTTKGGGCYGYVQSCHAIRARG